MMQLHTIDTGFFKLDGGAMFGIVPQKLWNRYHSADENNMCTWSMRCLLVELDDRKILFDTGIGDKQDDKFRSHFEPHGQATLLGSLAERGLSPEDITDVFLTHLHFDHVGGAVRYDEAGKLVPTFPRARYWSNQRHYDWALSPNAREKASFLKENFVPLAEAGVLKMIDHRVQDQEWLPGIQVRFLYGHTEAMMMPIFRKGNKKIYYTVDLIPSSFHLSMPFVMAFDVRPLKTLAEKAALYDEVIDQPDCLLIFEHDPETAAATVVSNEKGRVQKGRVVQPAVFFNE
jgi:glyoxylase-like metal-dependent hydrolase (beta-lactamase superfamily II)